MPQPAQLPDIVRLAYARADTLDFPLSSEPVVGQLLSTLACAVPPNGRILELGTGAGVGVAWLVHGLSSREDVKLISVDTDPSLHEVVSSELWPSYVKFELVDGAKYVDNAGQFDLIFADAAGGKLENLEGSIAALRLGGVLIVDDMDLAQHEDEELRAALATVRERLFEDPRLLSVSLEAASGMIVSSRTWSRSVPV
jgi:predicted O-methyltransferase YrrM